MRFVTLLAWIPVAAQAFRKLEANETCFSGFIMDTFCIQRGTLLDNPQLETLRYPDEHSIHCLVDVPSCVESGYEVLVPGNGTDGLYQSVVKLDSFGNDEIVRQARYAGDSSCSSCNGTGTQRKGFSATVIGFLQEGTTPPILVTTEVMSDYISCDQFLAADSVIPTVAPIVLPPTTLPPVSTSPETFSPVVVAPPSQAPFSTTSAPAYNPVTNAPATMIPVLPTTKAPITLYPLAPVTDAPVVTTTTVAPNSATNTLVSSIPTESTGIISSPTTSSSPGGISASSSTVVSWNVLFISTSLLMLRFKECYS